MGKDKVDIMTSQQPLGFKDMKPIEKNFYSLFSKSENNWWVQVPTLKIPFTYSSDEVSQLNYDTRVGGYGVLFSGIFILSLF